jgi:SAM-dependent methyltransferase
MKDETDSARWRMAHGVDPLSWCWGLDRGVPFHRYYLEKFLSDHRSDISGTVLEFQDPQYSHRFAPTPIEHLDILHIDDSNLLATLVGDLTQQNDLPSNRFDCIICTHVLHVIGEVEHAVREIHRMLRSNGVLLVGVPGVSMDGVDSGELWRFTPGGLRWLLARIFGDTAIDVRGYGNSLTAAAELRGLVTEEFTLAELEHHDPHYAIEVCARAVKAPSQSLLR